MSKYIKPWNPLPFDIASNQHTDRPYTDFQWTSLYPCYDELTALRLMDGPPSCSMPAEHPACSLALQYGPPDSNERCCCQSPSKVNYPTDPVSGHYQCDAATKLLDKACQKLQGIQNIPAQRVTDLEAAIRQLRQISCILDSCTISASYEVSQACYCHIQLKGQAHHRRS